MATYAATDFHGMYSLWKQIKEYMKPDDTLYYLGDAIDRGPHGWEIFTELLDDPRVIFIRGNHEDMMYNAYTTCGELSTEWFKHWNKNGGDTTRANMQNVSHEEKMKYIEKIKNMSTMEVYKNQYDEIFLLTHAGCTPHKEYWNLPTEAWSYVNMWSRKHFSDPWPQDKINEHKYVIHGHTPVQFLYRYFSDVGPSDGLPIKYCNGHKIDLDSGAFSSNIATLYNLDFNYIEMIFRGDFEDEYFNK
jgi:serine/threonine protein phosphatase 1